VSLEPGSGEAGALSGEAVALSSDAVAPAREHLPRGEDFLLWPPGIQTWGYRIVDRLFATRTIERAPRPSPIERGPEIEPRYRVGGVELGVDDFMDRNVVAGLLVLKDRRIVLERYGLGLRPDDRWSTMSTVKSMTAMLVGAALRDGALRGVDDPVTRYLPRLRGSAYDGVSLRHLMTMSSGVRWIEDYADRASDVNRYSRSLAAKVPAGVLDMMAALARAHAPGSVWNYNSGDTYLLGALLSAATGMPLARYMSERIWKPCGMEFDAYYTLESEGGQEIGGSRAGVALRDFGRFARLVLDDGVVDGSRILPAGWVDEVARQAFALPGATLAMPRVRAAGLVGYGYSWWLDRDGAMIANGFAGQRIYIHRGERLAVVTLAAFAQPPYLSPQEPDHPAEVAAFTQSLRGAPG
jgi:CubicO group peptidase (beta-lactamase class C family)